MVESPLKSEYATLVKAAATGEEDAMERLLVRAQEAAYRFSLLVCGHPQDAEDVMQDALLKTYQHVRRIADPEAFRTWLYTTVRHACLMKRRRRAGEPSTFATVDDGMQVAAGGTQVEVADQLRRALTRLPASQRMILVLREIEGLSTREVATITGISEANVKTRLHRARLMLRTQLEHV